MTEIVDALPIFASVAPTSDFKGVAVATTETLPLTVCVLPDVKLEPLTVCLVMP